MNSFTSFWPPPSPESAWKQGWEARWSRHLIRGLSIPLYIKPALLFPGIQRMAMGEDVKEGFSGMCIASEAPKLIPAQSSQQPSLSCRHLNCMQLRLGGFHSASGPGQNLVTFIPVSSSGEQPLTFRNSRKIHKVTEMSVFRAEGNPC